MPAHVAIVHGWSDTSKSFYRLRDFLQANGHDVAQIWLGDYVSMDDDVRIEDVAKRMDQTVRSAMEAGDLAEPFDLIVHSTGGLVAREWLQTCHARDLTPPVKRLIMLAPANFGSRLAAVGKSMIGRVARGWNNWFQTGEQMLKALELASPYQWNLARRDLLDPHETGQPGPYGADRVWPFVITGTRAYSDGLRKIVNEHGSDGTVRAAAANLNTVGLTLDFATDPLAPAVRRWRPRTDLRFPCAVVPDRDHGSVTQPAVVSGGGASDLTGRLILEALACDSVERYAAIEAEWAQISEDTGALAHDADSRAAMFPDNAPDAQAYHQHMQVLVHVRDDHGRPVDDYFLEFFSPRAEGEREAVFFHREVLSHVHRNTIDPSFRCLFIDRTDLLDRYYPSLPADARTLAMSISAAPLGPNVRYFDSTKEGASGHVPLHEQDAADERAGYLHRNQTHLVEIIVPRQPRDDVFQLSR